MPFSYVHSAFGLLCVSDAPIPGFQLQAPQKSADLTLSFGTYQERKWALDALKLPARLVFSSTGQSDADSPSCVVTSYGSDEYFELSYPDGARFMVDCYGRRVSSMSDSSLSVTYLCTYVRGPVMGFALRRRGRVPLHASAVKVGAQGIVVCGAVESGKSTTAAALTLRGISVLSDDIVALRQCDNKFRIDPGYPWICLWPDAVLNLFGDADALPKITAEWDKRYLALDAQGFEASCQSLTAIYILAAREADSSAPRVEDLSPRQGVLELIQNTYMNWLLNPAQRAQEFDILTRLTSAIPVRKVVPHADPRLVGTLCDCILRDAMALETQQKASV